MWIAHAYTNNIGCVHYISTLHSCDARCVLYGNIMNSFWLITACIFLWTFYNRLYTTQGNSVFCIPFFASLEVNSKCCSTLSSWWDKTTHQEFNFGPFLSILQEINRFFGSDEGLTLEMSALKLSMVANLRKQLSW